MQLVGADANILIAGIGDEKSLYRKILTVFLFGKLDTELRLAEDNRAEIQQLLAEAPGARFGGQPDPDQVVADAEARIATLEEHIPTAPRDFGLVVSPPILKEVEDILSGARSKLGSQPPERVRSLIAALSSISVRQVLTGFDPPIQDYTEGRDPKDDPIIHTAMLANAEWVLSQDKDVSVNWKRPTKYEQERTGRMTQAVRLNYFIREVLCKGLRFSNDDLTDIDGTLLNRAI